MVICCSACRHRHINAAHPQSGNAVEDYFYKMGYTFPVHCAVDKPICKAEDTLGRLGRLHRLRRQLAEQALAEAQKRLYLDSLTRGRDCAVAIFPIAAIALDEPFIVYRVLVKTYRNNPSRNRDGLALWQVIDSNKIIVDFHDMDFVVNADGTIEYSGLSN